MSFTPELREFALKGNVVEMTVGIIIVAPFAEIVASLVSNYAPLWIGLGRCY
ncbi:MAG: large conductance mechanosensitive channel [Paraglaciecola sp.]|jgi:large conductance mechanosensitive channel